MFLLIMNNNYNMCRYMHERVLTLYIRKIEKVVITKKDKSNFITSVSDHKTNI